MKHYDAILIGAGPVGLYLAARLRQAGWEVAILERRDSLATTSRAIGIHQCSLPLLDAVHCLDHLREAALCIDTARVYLRRKLFHTLTLQTNRRPAGVCLVPQDQTLRILAERAGPVTFSTSFDQLQQDDQAITVTCRDLISDQATSLSCRWLIGCDGHRSTVRQALQIQPTGRTYPDTYIMGDFPETTDFPHQAAVWLSRDGLVESFPLPDAWRRWVVKVAGLPPTVTGQQIAEAVQARTGWRLDADAHRMLSAFQPETRLTPTFRSGRALLVGDAAHIVSPIGGQGMNLGWLNAEALARTLLSADQPDLRAWEAAASQRARRARMRGFLNMWLGRRHGRWLHALALAIMLKTPLRQRFVRAFTMRDLALPPHTIKPLPEASA